MTSRRPDQTTFEKLIALGNFADGDTQLSAMVRSLSGNSYLRSFRGIESFDWLGDETWGNACAFVRGLTRAETERLTNTGGSVSPVKDAYRCLEMRDPVAAMEIAAWIVDHSNNDYIPFPMRKIRYAFAEIKRTACSWSECRQALDRWCAGEWGRQERVAQELAEQKPEAERRRQIRQTVARRVDAERAEIQQARASAREKLLRELRALPLRERLEHIAWDDTRSLSCYPADFALCTVEDLKQLDPVTKERLVAKLRERQKGPWQKLAKALESKL